MNTRYYMVIIKGEIKTSEIMSCGYNRNTQKWDVKFNTGKIYSYAYLNVEKLTEPEVLNPNMYRISREGREFFDVKAIYVFRSRYESYWHICFGNGSERDYHRSELNIVESCLTQSQSSNVFEYIKQIAGLSNIRNEETGEKLLSKRFDKISFVGSDVALAKYLNPSSLQGKRTGCEYIPIFPAEEIAVIDHHPLEVICTERMRLQPNMGSCATLVWTMLQEMHYPVGKNRDLGTALYYGLYMDTNQFSELSNPVDMDMRESLNFDKNQISLFRNSNISLRELEIAGVAMLRCNYNDDYQFAVIHSQPCDPNVLGLISDFLLQVAGVNTCVVYNEDSGGYKFSVRSCIREVNASELSDYLSEGIGSGGGHYEKAGGYISMKLYEEKYPTLHSEAYFNNRMTQYFDTFRILYAKDRAFPVSEGTRYQRRKIPLACVRASDLAELGRVVSVRTQNGTMDIDTRQNICYTLERNGELHRVAGERFHRILELSDAPVSEDYCRNMTYVPRVKDGTDGRNHLITEYVRMCMPKDEFRIYAIRVTQGVKVFPVWDEDGYMTGRAGDYLAASEDDLHNIFIETEQNLLNYFEEKGL